MKARYLGPKIGAMMLTPNKIYTILGVEEEMLRVIDDDPNDPDGCLYDPVEPGNLSGTLTGRWEIVEDDDKGTLAEAIKGSIV